MGNQVKWVTVCVVECILNNVNGQCNNGSEGNPQGQSTYRMGQQLWGPTPMGREWESGRGKWVIQVRNKWQVTTVSEWVPIIK